MSKDTSRLAYVRVTFSDAFLNECPDAAQNFGQASARENVIHLFRRRFFRKWTPSLNRIETSSPVVKATYPDAPSQMTTYVYHTWVKLTS